MNKEELAALDRAELLPCPFCGGKAKVVGHQCAEDACTAYVECTDCGAKTDYFEDAYTPRPEAIAAWNTRAIPRDLQGLVDALRDIAGTGDPLFLSHSQRAARNALAALGVK